MTATNTECIANSVRAVLSPDLLKPLWRRLAALKGCPVTGHCYAASEAVFHLAGGSPSGWVPKVLNHATWPEGLQPGQTHWYLGHSRTGAVIDVTSGQFAPLSPRYEAGKGCGFLTRQPSKRAAQIMSRVVAMMGTTEFAAVAER